jgi:hypothetical protein
MTGETDSNILYPSEPDRLSREEVSGGLGLLMAGINESVNKKADTIGLVDDDQVQLAIERLERRVRILGDGLKPSANNERLYNFMERAKSVYTLSVDAIETYVEDKDRLINMIGRVGLALQGDMHVHKMLTASAKRKLENFKNT